MNNYLKHFEAELKILKSTVGKGDRLLIEPYIPIIKKIIKVFGNQGHSGCSAPMEAGVLANTIKNVLAFKPLSPITGNDGEWTNVHDAIYQNKRLSAVFKDGANGKPYYLDAVVWKNQTGSCYTGQALKSDGTKILSRQYIKFPFVPKTFYVDVIEKEIAKGDWEFYIKDERQLEEALRYFEGCNGEVGHE